MEYIIALAMHSNLRLLPEDIETAEIIQRSVTYNDLCSIFVIFKCFNKRQQFLRIKDLPGKVQIVEALTKQNNALFRQAESLYNFGYSFVYHQGGNIFVRRTSTTDPIHIRCIQDVKNLKRR